MRWDSSWEPCESCVPFHINRFDAATGAVAWATPTQRARRMRRPAWPEQRSKDVERLGPWGLNAILVAWCRTWPLSTFQCRLDLRARRERLLREPRRLRRLCARPPLDAGERTGCMRAEYIDFNISTSVTSFDKCEIRMSLAMPKWFFRIRLISDKDLPSTSIV